MVWFSRNKWWIAGAALFIVSAVVRYLAADQTEHPSGWDGYYYVMQMQSWLLHSKLQSADASLIYPYFITIAWLTGDIVVAFKIGVALLSALLVVAAYEYLHRRGVAFAWAFAAGAYLVFSPLITYFVLQFPKNVLGLVFLIFLVDALVRSAEANRFNWQIAMAAVLTLVTHRMTAAFALIILVAFFARRASWKWLAGAVVFAALVSLLPGVLHLYDLERFADPFTAVPQFAPYSFYLIFQRTASGWLQSDLIFITLFVLATIVMDFISRPYRITTMPWMLVLLVGFFPFFPFSPGSTGHRFFLVTPVALILFASHFTWKPETTTRWAQLAAIALLILSWVSYRSYRPYAMDPPNGIYTRVVDALEQNYDPGRYRLVIAHKGLAEMIRFRTGFDVLNWQPPPTMDPAHVLRVANAVPYQGIRRYVSGPEMEEVHTLGAGYIAIPEMTWSRLVTNATSAGDKFLLRHIFADLNPTRQRPDYLNKGK